MATLDELIQQSLAQLVQQGGGPTEQALFNRSAGDIQTAYQNNAQQIAENTFARGLGISDIAAHLQAENLKNQAAAVEKARQDAFLGGQQAQLSALGQAAAITQGEANRAQQAALQKRALSAQRGMANTQMLAQGLAGGVGALGNVAGLAYGPEIRSGLRGLFGLHTPAMGSPTRPGPGEGMPGGAAPTIPALTDMSAPSGGLGALAGGDIPNLTLPDFSSTWASSVSTPSYSFDFNPSLDLSGLYDTSMPTLDLSSYFQPGYDWSNIGWG